MWESIHGLRGDFLCNYAYCLFRLFSRHIYQTQSFQENRPFYFQVHIVLKTLVSLMGRLVACSARIDGQTDRRYGHTQRLSTVTFVAHAAARLFNTRVCVFRFSRQNMLPPFPSTIHCLPSEHHHCTLTHKPLASISDSKHICNRFLELLTPTKSSANESPPSFPPLLKSIPVSASSTSLNNPLLLELYRAVRYLGVTAMWKYCSFSPLVYPYSPSGSSS